MGLDVRKLVGVASKVILLPCTKLIFEISYLFAIIEKVMKTKPADNIPKKCQVSDEEIKCCSSNSSHLC